MFHYSVHSCGVFADVRWRDRVLVPRHLGWSSWTHLTYTWVRWRLKGKYNPPVGTYLVKRSAVSDLWLRCLFAYTFVCMNTLCLLQFHSVVFFNCRYFAAFPALGCPTRKSPYVKELAPTEKPVTGSYEPQQRVSTRYDWLEWNG